ncbi:MAG: coproporphyrinogen dehydrogenase HemZ [Christensenellaceae bacterium]|jgi:coproporphyrinogen dehydrogenase HemZ
MVILYTETPVFFNDICDEIRLFTGQEQIVHTESKEDNAEHRLMHCFWVADGVYRSRAEYYVGGKRVSAAEQKQAAERQSDALYTKKITKRLVKSVVYEALKAHYKITMPWGSLTGIRPTKLLRELAAEGGEAYAREMFLEAFDVSPQKTRLAEEIVYNQRKHICTIKNNTLDIYIGIPFCTSRCKYCSFISRDLKNAGLLKDEYLKCLHGELLAMRETVQSYDVRAVYVGGGTPTALEAGELESLLERINEVFPKRGEFTVEAGRPDTVTKEKLRIIKNAGAGRVSINAQTTNDRTLAAIGRNHTTEDFFRAFALAREVGFDSINTDIIAGLPGETLADMQKTLDDIMAFSPENVTVHTLAIKRSSEFAEGLEGKTDAQQTAQMVEYARAFLESAGLAPYYLYRQKYMNGNLENVGYAKPGLEGIYNIDNMEETASVMAFGAGGISKLVLGNENRIERCANVKDVGHYVARAGEMAQRKKTLFENTGML